jgi:hypothetical protein
MLRSDGEAIQKRWGCTVTIVKWGILATGFGSMAAALILVTAQPDSQVLRDGLLYGPVTATLVLCWWLVRMDTIRARKTYALCHQIHEHLGKEEVELMRIEQRLSVEARQPSLPSCMPRADG